MLATNFASSRPWLAHTPAPSFSGRRPGRYNLVVSAALGGDGDSEKRGGEPNYGRNLGRRGGGKRRNGRKARQPGQFELEDITPPRKSLGVHMLEPNTTCGDYLEVAPDGEACDEAKCYVVERVVLRYKLKGGKYVRDHNKLEVTPSTRYFLNQHLEQIMKNSDVGGDTI